MAVNYQTNIPTTPYNNSDVGYKQGENSQVIAKGNPTVVGQTAVDFTKTSTGAMRAKIIKEQFLNPFAGINTDVVLPVNSGTTVTQTMFYPMLHDTNKDLQGLDYLGRARTGNLYGSSNDFATIKGELPVLGDEGGNVNRMNIAPVQITGSVSQFGVFCSVTRDEMDHGSVPDLYEIRKTALFELVKKVRATQTTLALLENAGNHYLTGTNFDIGTMGLDGTSNAPANSDKAVISYSTLKKMATHLSTEQVPHDYNASSGSNKIDTKIVGSRWQLHVHPSVIPVFREMKDTNGDNAFTKVSLYSGSTPVHPSEKGTVGEFAIVENRTLPKIRGGKVASGTAAGAVFYETYNPVLSGHVGTVTGHKPDDLDLATNAVKKLYSIVTRTDKYAKNNQLFGTLFKAKTNADDLYGKGIVKDADLAAATDTKLSDAYGNKDLFVGIKYNDASSITSEYYAVYPCLFVAKGSYGEIRAQRRAKGGKPVDGMVIYEDTMFNKTSNDQYGRLMSMSIQWKHGILVTEPEKISVAYTCVPK